MQGAGHHVNYDSMWLFERRITVHAEVSPGETTNNYELSVLVQMYDHSAKVHVKGSFSLDGASVLGFSPCMHLLVISRDQPPLETNCAAQTFKSLRTGTTEEVEGHLCVPGAI